jgi:phosphate:Na+ symporter
VQELIFGLIGGTALLMYGVDKMGDGLEKASGEMMRKILTVLTGRVWSAFLVGTFLTALVQSSTAITVLTVGFVNAGLMKLPQAVGIIYGANIGTTITAQLMALSFQFKLTDFALPVIGVGFAVEYFARSKVFKNAGSALMGFGMMFLGLKILNSGIPYIQSSELLRYFFAHYASRPVIGILLGALATALVHSSAATVGLVMVLGQAGLLDLTGAVTIMLGDNIGTCITAQLASLTGNIGARRTAWGHTLYNLFGVVGVALLLPWFVGLVEIMTAAFQPGGDIGSQIANSHTLFNIVSAAIFLPLTPHYVRFLEWAVRGNGRKRTVAHLDRLLLPTPVAAFRAVVSEIVRAAKLAQGMVNRVMQALWTGSPGEQDSIARDEALVNQMQKEITMYVVEISKQPLTHSQSIVIPALINGINNVERIGDHATELFSLVRHKNERGLPFSPEAQEELRELQDIVFNRMFAGMITALQMNDPAVARQMAALEDRVDELCQQLEQSHLRRLEEGKCAIESGMIFLDVISHFERIADHIYKICLLATDEMRGEMRVNVGKTKTESPAVTITPGGK